MDGRVRDRATFKIIRHVLLALIVLLTVAGFARVASAATGDRTLYLYYTHTKETAKFTFRKNGRYDAKVLADLNWFLRDWRRDEPTKMDPGLFDLIWEVYQESGARQPIHIVSAYRAPETNEMLRSKSSAVAKNSRHTHGMAMDFFIPGIPISKLREIAMRKQVGGVGYYPTSGSPFVHLDTGSVRAWPRMTHAQLQRLFPNGKTMHIPADGNLLSQSGYQYAKAQWTKCHEVPCGGPTYGNVRVASASSTNAGEPSKPKFTLLDWLTGNDQDGDDEDAAGPSAQVASVESTSAIVPVPAPLPTALRPPPRVSDGSFAVASADLAPLPVSRPGWLSVDPTPVASIGSSSSAEPESSAMIAYTALPQGGSDPQSELQTLLDSRASQAAGIRLASAGSSENGLSALIQNSLEAVGNEPLELTLALADTARVKARQAELIAPDLDHIVEIFVDPAAMSSARYAVIFEHDTPDLDPSTELGGYGGGNSLQSDPAFGLNMSRFTNRRALMVALR